MRASTIEGNRYSGRTRAGDHDDRPSPGDPATDPAAKRAGFEIMAGMLIGRVIEGRIPPAQCRQLLALAAESARDGLSVDSATDAVRAAVDKVALDGAGGRLGDGCERGGVVGRLEMLRKDLVAATSAALVRAHPDGARPASMRSLASVIAESRSAVPEQRCASYAVLAVAFPPHPDESVPDTAEQAAREKVVRVHRELDRRCDPATTTTLTEHGGTIVVPAELGTPRPYDDLVAAVARAAGVSVTATLVFASVADLPGATDRAHELLDVVQRLGRGPGLYRFTDLALEYQLTRPGRGLERLKTILAPLENQPRLLQTLVVHIAANLSRQHTASVMKVHRNTIDYRLRRIQELTGYDPSRPPGIWYLQAGLIIRSLGHSDGSVG
ncbi:hypothetical protein A5780_35630 [Nocardia sp. 852002-20019_SCH5090214]|jgi:hypothetical protein|uniref:PucR family transcriptional regulator n=1 Tax=Nocardia TaxID=1817 RepID=UPI0007EBF2FF|nr:MULTISPECIES: helix-turn-helix domain-containing protein [Nocardia]MBV7706238.1 helix-turn-helix domain-containing protein [Nocardia nova]OBA45658.1 hypothetical protein A5780_35630 [Nocardia sp. 852002-20019_SCH5090214]PPI96623.1 PucR family transcriptional regulator [Nocardia nova]